MNPRDLRKHFGHLLLIALSLLLLSWLTDWGSYLALVVLLLYVARLKWQQWRLYHWLNQGKQSEPPEAKGLWGQIFDLLYSIRKRGQRDSERLVQALKRVKNSAQAMPDGIVMLNSKGNIDWWNQASEQLLGLKQGDKGQLISFLLRDPKFLAFLQNPSPNVQIQAPNDAQRLLQLTLVQYNQNEQLLLARDITRLKQLEQMRQDFVANASHELRTPLTVFRGYLETMLDYSDQLSPVFQRALKQMQQQTERMNNLVNDLLVLTRLDSDIRAEEQSLVDVEKLLTEIAEDAMELNDAKQHQIEVKIETKLGLLANENELRSAISNLVYNAVHYTPEQGMIRISWSLQGDHAVIAVQDNGIGIEPHHITRLTERFYRVDSSRATATGGTGLGLAIVKHVLQLHHAQLQIDSELDQGSTFSAVFPLTLTQPMVELNAKISD